MRTRFAMSLAVGLMGFLLASGVISARDQAAAKVEAAATAAAETSPAPIPLKIAPEEPMLAWLNALNGKSDDEVVKQLGQPAQRHTWKFKSKDEPLLEYKTTNGTVSLYFYDGNVVKVSYQLMST